MIQNDKITEIIIKDAEEILTLAQNFNKYTSTRVPPIYVDLTLSKIKNLYVELQLLLKQEDELSEITGIDEDIQGTVQHEGKHLIAGEHKEDVSTDEKKSGEKAANNEEILIEAISSIEDKAPQINNTELMLRHRQEHILATQLKFDKIEDIKPAIDLTKKIWFIKELFNGNIDTYNKSLDMVNSFEYIEDALKYFDENFDWDYDNKTVKDFMEFVYRRFI